MAIPEHYRGDMNAVLIQTYSFEGNLEYHGLLRNQPNEELPGARIILAYEKINRKFLEQLWTAAKLLRRGKFELSGLEEFLFSNGHQTNHNL